jgi:hypothetical protein
VVQLHDNFFKAAFSMREVMEDYVRQFLPKNIIEGIDFESLVQDDTQYATANIKSFESDMAWNCLFGKQKTKAKIVFIT